MAYGKRNGNGKSHATLEQSSKATVADCLDSVPPSDLSAEAALIGCVILNGAMVDDLILIVEPSDFHDNAHELVWQTILEMHDKNKHIDALTLQAALKKSGRLEAIGGVSEIVRLAQSVPSWYHATAYAKEVRELSIKRQLLTAAAETVRDCTQDGYSPDECLERHEVRVMGITDKTIQNGTLSAKEMITSAMDSLEKRWSGDATQAGLKTRFSGLDQLLGSGLRPGQFCILAARPGVGKTAFAMNIAESVACDKNQQTLVVSLEMTSEELIERMLSSVSGVNAYRMRSGTLTPDDRSKIVEAAAHLSQSPLHVVNDTSLTVRKIGAHARRHKRKHGLSLLIIDYIQLIDPTDRTVSREQQVAAMSRQLKLLAMDLKIPVICLAQLNRQVELRKDSRPKLSDLRESGSLEQDADIVIFVHREEMFRTGEDREQFAGLAEIIVAKQRSGENGVVDLIWRKEIVRFEEKAADRYKSLDEYNREREPDKDFF